MTDIDRLAGFMHGFVEDRPWTDPRIDMLMRDEWRSIARAVLMHLREPSEAMLEAGWDAMGDWRPPRAIWQSMIDAALSVA